MRKQKLGRASSQKAADATVQRIVNVIKSAGELERAAAADQSVPGAKLETFGAGFKMGAAAADLIDDLMR